MINLDTVVCQSSSMFSSDLGDETIILQIEKGMYYGLNSVGARILKLIEQPISVKYLCEQLVIEYDVSPQVCQQEVSQLLIEMLSSGLVEVADKKL